MYGLLKPHHFHDLGKLIARVRDAVGVLQLLAVPADLRGEPGGRDPVHDRRASTHGWQYLALFLVVFHFFVPLLLLLSRDLQAHVRIGSCIVALWHPLHALRRHLHAGVAGVRGDRREPAHARGGEHASHFFVHWLDLAAPLAIGGLWVWMFFTQLATAAAVRRSAIRICVKSLQQGGGH